jgi:hypothetical protein
MFSINHQVALRANFKMYSRSAKGGEKGDPNRNPWLAKMGIWMRSVKTVNQVKSFKSLADGKDVFIETKTGSGIFAYISSITCAPCKTSSDWIRVLVTQISFSSLGAAIFNSPTYV